MKPEEVLDFIRSVYKMRSWQKACASRKRPEFERERVRWENEVDGVLEKEKPKLFDNYVKD